MPFKIKFPCTILKTNLIHLLGFYIVVVVYTAIETYSKNYRETIHITDIARLIIGAPFFLLIYGLIFLLGFYLAIIILDVILLSLLKQKVNLVVFIEWLFISSIFIYYAIKYEYWLWILLAGSFLTTQFVRANKIKKYYTYNHGS